MLRTPNEDIRSLKELVHYGLKGMAAYVEHAHNLGYESPEIFAFMQHALSELTRNDITVEELVQLTLETGKYGVSAMAQLDKANTSSYGNPEISQVSLGVRNNPGILISGHDLKDLEELLEQTEGTGVDVYTSFFNRISGYFRLIHTGGVVLMPQFFIGLLILIVACLAFRQRNF